MGMPRSPMQRMVDQACGFDPDAPIAPRDTITLRCPSCKKEKSADWDKTDPPGCAVVETTCHDCHNSGDFELVDYFNAAGEQINLDGETF